MLDQFSQDGIVVEKAIGFWLNRVYQRTRSEMYRLFAEQGDRKERPLHRGPAE